MHGNSKERMCNFDGLCFYPFIYEGLGLETLAPPVSSQMTHLGFMMQNQ